MTSPNQFIKSGGFTPIAWLCVILKQSYFTLLSNLTITFHVYITEN